MVDNGLNWFFIFKLNVDFNSKQSIHITYGKSPAVTWQILVALEMMYSGRAQFPKNIQIFGRGKQ